MAITVLEAIDSRPITTSGGRNIATRKFHIWNDSSPITTAIGIYQLFGTNNIPIYGEQFPGAATPFVAADPSVKLLDGHTDTWVCEWRYQDGAVGGSQNLQPNDVGYIEFSAGGDALFEDSWRSLTDSELSALVAPAGLYPNGVAASEADIGGISIDSAGYPVSGALRKTITLTVSEIRDTQPNIGYLMGFVGRRNNVAFGGAPIGSVVYKRPSVSRIGLNRYQWSHEFVCDNFYHLLQSPMRQPDGSVQLGTSGATDGKAEFVYFRQPFRNFANLYAISPYFAGVF